MYAVGDLKPRVLAEMCEAVWQRRSQNRSGIAPPPALGGAAACGAGAAGQPRTAYRRLVRGRPSTASRRSNGPRRSARKFRTRAKIIGRQPRCGSGEAREAGATDVAV
jgi:hypothetical protein